MDYIVAIFLLIVVAKIIFKLQYKKLESEVLRELKFQNWNVVPYYDASVIVKSRQALEKYDDIKFFKENPEMFAKAEKVINRKDEITVELLLFLDSNKFKKRFQYKKIKKHIDDVMSDAFAF